MNCLYWKDNITNKCVIEWIEHGVPVEFDFDPQPFRCKNRAFKKCEAEFIDQEVSRLLHNKYISIIISITAYILCNIVALLQIELDIASRKVGHVFLISFV